MLHLPSKLQKKINIGNCLKFVWKGNGQDALQIAKNARNASFNAIVDIAEPYSSWTNTKFNMHFISNNRKREKIRCFDSFH